MFFYIFEEQNQKTCKLLYNLYNYFFGLYCKNVSRETLGI